MDISRALLCFKMRRDTEYSRDNIRVSQSTFNMDKLSFKIFPLLTHDSLGRADLDGFGEQTQERQKEGEPEEGLQHRADKMSRKTLLLPPSLTEGSGSRSPGPRRAAASA